MLVFGASFFPSDDKLFSTMAAFGTFAVGGEWGGAMFYSLIAATSLLCVLSLARRHASAERVEPAKA